MQDIPMFTTENGVATLSLKEIPYKGIGYITIQDASQPEAFLQECVQFCKMAGAESVYAAGHKILEAYPLYTAVVEMSVNRDDLPETDAALFPVTEKTAEQWRNIYNDKMRPIPNAATMEKMDMTKLVQQGGGYFVHRGDQLLGIGIARDQKVEAVAGVKPGKGREVMLALCSCLQSQRVVLEVSSANEKAIRLYKSLGFTATKELSRWYDVLTRKNT